MAIAFPDEGFPPIKPDLESIESFDNSQIGGVEKFSTISGSIISISDVVAKAGDTMTGSLILPSSAAGFTSGSVRIPAGTAPTSPLEGAIWNDSSQKGLVSYADAIKQFYIGAVFAQTADVTVASTAAETTLLGSGVGTLTLPVNFFTVGKSIRVRGFGYFSDTATPNLTMKVKLGSTVIVSTGVVALAGTIANNFWEVDSTIACRSVGAGGTVKGQGKFKYDESTHLGTMWGMVTTSTVSVDTTATQAVGLTATWGTSSASNTITCSNFTVEVLY